jgi:hypothetical protein
MSRDVLADRRNRAIDELAETVRKGEQAGGDAEYSEGDGRVDARHDGRGEPSTRGHRRQGGNRFGLDLQSPDARTRRSAARAASDTAPTRTTRSHRIHANGHRGRPFAPTHVSRPAASVWRPRATRRQGVENAVPVKIEASGKNLLLSLARLRIDLNLLEWTVLEVRCCRLVTVDVVGSDGRVRRGFLPEAHRGRDGIEEVPGRRLEGEPGVAQGSGNAGPFCTYGPATRAVRARTAVGPAIQRQLQGVRRGNRTWARPATWWSPFADTLRVVTTSVGMASGRISTTEPVR